MPRTPPPPLRFKVRTATLDSEFAGSHAEGLRYLFICLPDAQARRRALHDLEEAHAKMLAADEVPS